MCDELAVGREHVPPKCFFPESLRTNLVTVPSCAAHNHHNNLDVDYVRNILCTQRGSNKAAHEVFETTRRSFEHSPKLKSETFREGRLVIVDGEKTGAYRVDLGRHARVMSSIAHDRAKNGAQFSKKRLSLHALQVHCCQSMRCRISHILSSAPRGASQRTS